MTFIVLVIHWLALIFASPEEASDVLRHECSPNAVDLARVEAFRLYREEQFNDAVNKQQYIVNCGISDYQLLFNSYLGAYVEAPSKEIIVAASRAVAAYMEEPDYYSDPGPLLIVTGQKAEAIRWYNEYESKTKIHDKSMPSLKVIIYYINHIDVDNTTPLERLESVRELYSR